MPSQSKKLVILLVQLLIELCGGYYSDRTGTTCFSMENESGGFYGQGTTDHERLEALRRYKGCETIIGNVVIMNINDPNGTHLEFFSSVRKITGYLAINKSNLTVLPFPNLQIISGQNLVYAVDQSYALFVSHINGISHPGLNSLLEISNGDVLFESNSVNFTAYSDKVDWDDVLSNGNASVVPREGETFDPDSYKCHPSCSYADKCWGPGAESCQGLSMTICASENGQNKCPGRCYAKEGYPEPFCCHKECAGGCSGNSNLDCFGCRNFNASGECVTQCPPPKIYDKKLFQNVENKDVLYGLGNECLKKCPSPYLTEEGNCVKQCSENLMVDDLTRHCVPCPPGGCPRRCKGFDSTIQLKEILGVCSDVKRGKKCSKLFINKYKNCTIISGNIDIDDKFGLKFGANAQTALEALSTVEEITGYLSIVTNNLFTDFSFLRNLKRIEGINMKSSMSCEQGSGVNQPCIPVTLQAAITIQALKDHRLKELRLNSLELIERGMVIINGYQSALCYFPEKAALARIMRKPDLNMTNDILLKFNHEWCDMNDYGCHDVCTGGCWGPGPGNCVQCSNFSFDGQCVTGCDAVQGVALYQDNENKTCKRCHPQCDPNSDCTGPGPDQCRQCKSFKDGPYCVAECPKIKYANSSGICMECDDACIEEMGCTGPNSFIGEGGCNFCPVVRLLEEAYTDTGHRLGQCAAKCAEDQYADGLKPYPNLPTHDRTDGERVKVCTPCHEYCSACKSSGTQTYVCTCKYAEDEGECLRECPVGKYRRLVDKICMPCDGPCPRNCMGSDVVPLDHTSIMEFTNCDLVEGSVIINYVSWNGPDPITASDLEALTEIITITGRLIIRDSPDPNFTRLDVLRRLKSVGSLLDDSRQRRQADNNYVVEIDNNTALETAELVALDNVSGPVLLSGGSLCYVDSVDWEDRLSGTQVDVAVSSCEEKMCHDECSEEGCLGPGASNCVSCANKEFEGSCMPQCQGPSYDDGTPLCKPCHENCQSCIGGGNQNCIGCKYVNDGSACVRECGNPFTYVDEEKECRDCDRACRNGCTGPGSYLGVGGCNFCEKHDQTNQLDNGQQQCAHTCPPRSYEHMSKEPGSDNSLRYECIPCHPQCSKCSHTSAFDCDECVNVKQGRTCQETCDDRYYATPSGECVECHSVCKTCIAPGSTNCTTCIDYEVPSKEIKITKECVKECPQNFAYRKIFPDGSQVCSEKCDDSQEAVMFREDLCHKIEGRSQSGGGAGENTVAVAVAVGVSIVIIFFVVGFICWKRVKQNQKKRMSLLKYAQRVHDTINPIYEPVMQDETVYPMNDGELVIVTEDKLEIGDVLGSGAFGKVYEGKWHPPESDNSDGLRVAIKILKESGDPESTREFFDEAVVMGKLDHKHLVRILCLCAGKMMLVTQLMPLGSLLDFVRKQKSNLTSHHLLTYCYQIAKGMAYLEENNVVHRDLAARNVLVQSPTYVRITDFGLAKMLSSKKQSFTSEGGKLPIKWLAIESLKYRQFTPRSDTWSYGVTIWEVLEFGQLPWRTKPPNELIRSLEMGERLTKPKTCTLEVYAVMLRCWVLEPAARPNFEDLMSSMEEFLKEPNRFVHTQHQNRASTEGSFLSPHASTTSEHRDSGIVDVDRNYENDDRAMAIQRALYDATSTLKHHETLHYDPALTADQDDVFSSESPSTARNSVIDMTSRHDYVQDYLVPDQYSVDEGNGTDSSQDRGYVKMNGSDYTDLEPASPEYSNTDDVAEDGITQSLLDHSKPPSGKGTKNKFLPNRTPSPRPDKPLQNSPTRPQSSPRSNRVRDDGYSCLKEPLSDVQQPLTGHSADS